MIYRRLIDRINSWTQRSLDKWAQERWDKTPIVPKDVDGRHAGCDSGCGYCGVFCQGCGRALIFAFLALIPLLFGCNSFADVNRGEGIQRTYKATYEQMWVAVPRAANEEGLTVAGEHKLEGIWFLQRGMTLFSYGEVVAVYVDEVTSSEVRVEVVSKPTYALNITASDWSEKLHNRISTEVFLAKMWRESLLGVR